MKGIHGRVFRGREPQLIYPKENKVRFAAVNT